MTIQDRTVKFSSSAKTPITIVEDTLDDTSTSVTYAYQDHLNLNRIINNNLIHLLENFSGDVEPPHPVEGQLWLDTSDPDSKQELGRLKIYMYQTSGLKFVDVAGTVMDKNGHLRHLGKIEAFNDLNNIPVNDNSFPEDPYYYKFLTTKAHCDSNYLSGYYSQDNTEFYIRGNRYVTYTKEQIYGAPFVSNDSRTLVQKKFVDRYYLYGKLNSDTEFKIPDDKKLYYDESIEMTHDYQLITKSKCDAKFAETIDKIANMSTNIKSQVDKIKKIANDPFDANDLANSGAIAIANEVKRLVAARPKPIAPTPVSLCGNTGTITLTPQPSGIMKIGGGLNGSAGVGAILFVDDSGYVDYGGYVNGTCTFKANGVNIVGATNLTYGDPSVTSPSYLTQPSDAGKTISFMISYSNTDNTVRTVSSSNSIAIQI